MHVGIIEQLSIVRLGIIPPSLGAARAGAGRGEVRTGAVPHWQGAGHGAALLHRHAALRCGLPVCPRRAEEKHGRGIGRADLMGGVRRRSENVFREKVSGKKKYVRGKRTRKLTAPGRTVWAQRTQGICQIESRHTVFRYKIE